MTTHASRKPKIVLTTTAEVSALTFYRGYLPYLVGRGWDVTLISSSTGKLHEFAAERGANSVALQMAREPAPLQDVRALSSWWKTLRQLKPDAVVAATPKAALLSMLAGTATKVPVRVYQIWGIRFETESGMRRHILRLMEMITARMATHIVCNSTSLATAARSLSIAGKKIPHVLGMGSSHGVDLGRFHPEASDISAPSRSAKKFLTEHAGKTIVGFVGRITPDKGLDTLLDAIGLCHERRIPVAFLIVGGVENAKLHSRLKTARNTLPIYLAGNVDDPRTFLRHFKVLCLPSRREGFPNVVLEAAAMEVPAIVTDSTGTVDSVEDEQTGTIIPTGDAVALADALEDVVRSPEKWQSYGVNARRRTEENYSQEYVWSLQETFLKELIK